MMRVGKIFYGNFHIPASIESAHFGWSGLQLYGKYIVDENNTNIVLMKMAC